ncbi:unnamed protein product [Pleuronectes platessa]|uniref:Uncharacterized protein n=1 Tax=Pleuronectes platessa TaxID=8262 RepID=A0A9N7YU22_PLEPL|nr:unnamed protein product [Pleuronectes platessa]
MACIEKLTTAPRAKPEAIAGFLKVSRGPGAPSSVKRACLSPVREAAEGVLVGRVGAMSDGMRGKKKEEKRERHDLPQPGNSIHAPRRFHLMQGVCESSQSLALAGSLSPKLFSQGPLNGGEDRIRQSLEKTRLHEIKHDGEEDGQGREGRGEETEGGGDGAVIHWGSSSCVSFSTSHAFPSLSSLGRKSPEASRPLGEDKEREPRSQRLFANIVMATIAANLDTGVALSGILMLDK